MSEEIDTVSVRLPKQVSKWIRTKAQAARRSISAEIVVLIEAAQSAEKGARK